MHNFISSLLFFNSSAQACATCGAGNDSSNFYYLILILIMTSIPLLMVGAMVLYLRKFRGQNDLDEQ